jgi:CBS domain-containing protein
MTQELSYEAIRNWKFNNIISYYSDPFQLNTFHDRTMKKVFKHAIYRLGKGEPPCNFSWFITGSGGRYEQGPISDQDHGLVYEISSPVNDQYFMDLGKEISLGLHIVGYPYCQGNVMSSNPLWCKSLVDWKEQLLSWMKESSWESIRNLQIFYDSRTLEGNEFFIHEIKDVIYAYQRTHPALLKRFMENVKHVKHAIGPFGQFIVEDYGEHGGMINLKYTAFLPYVNAIRLLSIKEGLFETSTIDRINRLIRMNGYGAVLRESRKHFLLLLKYRNTLYDAKTYDDTHFLHVKKLNREERREIKKIIKDGKRLHQYVTNLILP